MSEAFIRGCTRATSPEDKVRISVAATPFPLPDKARQPFHVEDTIIARDSGDAPGAGPRMMNLMEVLIKQNFNLAKRSDSHAGPLILYVISISIHDEALLIVNTQRGGKHGRVDASTDYEDFAASALWNRAFESHVGPGDVETE